MSEFPTAGRLAGIDYGHVRIGVAVTDPDRRIASPYANYTRRDEARDAQFFQKLAADEQVVGFVVGLPLHTDGQESEKSREVRRFAVWLAQVTDRPVCFYDERFTTREATYLLEEAQLTKKQRKRRLDKVAAQLVLAAFLEAGGGRPEAGGRRREAGGERPEAGGC